MKDNFLTNRAPQALYRLAKSAAVQTLWSPVCSLQKRYELDKHGRLRNSQTKKLLKLYNGCYYMRDGAGKNISTSRSSLLWEVFGIAPTKKSRMRRPCILAKDNQLFHFDTLKAAATFLANNYFYTVGHMQNFLKRRLNIVCGWKVTYLDDFTPNLKYLSVEGRRNQKAWAHHDS